MFESNTGELFQLVHRVEQAYAKATEALDLSKYFDFDFDNVQYGPFDGTDEASSALSAAPSPVPVASKPVKPRGSVHDTAAEANLTPRSAKLKEKALAMLNDDKPHRTAPLGRRHTAPTLLHTAPSPYPSRTSADRASSRVHSRHAGRALQALQEAEE